MKTLTFYFDLDSASKANQQFKNIHWKRYVRTEVSDDDDIGALEKASPKPGETVLNSVTLIEPPKREPSPTTRHGYTLSHRLREEALDVETESRAQLFRDAAAEIERLVEEMKAMQRTCAETHFTKP